MKVILFGKNIKNIEKLVESNGFQIVDKNPDFVIAYGGDGTLMRSEEKYPGIAKIALRDSAVCKKCSKLSNEEVLRAVKNGKYKTEELIKLEVSSNDKKLIGLNDITVHNKDARRGIRYSLSINDLPIGNEIIGDGVVIATPFGSTAYYRSITDSFFEVGIGLAFNNSTEQADHMVISEDSIIKVSIIRGATVVYADNHEESIDLEEGSSVVIKKSHEKATIVMPPA
jgi:NAD+ kinase